jgi:hypothetical protein
MMHLVDVISQDVRQVARALARTPGFTGIAVVTLALGIGVVTTMFTVANAAIVRPLPFERPHPLYEVRRIAAGGGRVWLSLPELQEWQSQNRAFSGLAGSTAFDFNLRGNPPSTISATGVTRTSMLPRELIHELVGGYAATRVHILIALADGLDAAR